MNIKMKESFHKKHLSSIYEHISLRKPEVETVTYVTESCAGAVSVVEEGEGEWTGEIRITAGAEALQGWVLQLVFSAAVDYLGGSLSVLCSVFMAVIQIALWEL